MTSRRPLVAFALLASLNGCRCNPVDERELPAAPSASAASAASVALVPSSAAFSSEECGPDIGGIDLVANAPAIILGELHGLASAPAFAGDLVCRLAFSNPGRGVVFALEIPSSEQQRFDTFLASEGRTADRTALVFGAFWKSNDGRASVARVDMLERTRQLNRRGANIRVRAIDAEGGARDETMAKHVIAAVNEKTAPVVVLVGNYHARLVSGASAKTMGELVKASVPDVVSLDNRYAAGEAWNCSPECGRHKVAAQDTQTDNRWRIERTSIPDDKGFAGVWRIGPARASDPVHAP